MSKHQADDHPNWTQLLQRVDHFVKLQMEAKVVLWDGEDIDDDIVKKLKTTNPQSGDCSQIDDSTSTILYNIPKIKQWGCSNLQYRNNKKQTKILKFFNRTYFSQLLFLDISQTALESVEHLGRLNAPNLRYISLNNNKISRLKSLQKMGSKGIESLKINNNPISQYEAIERINCSLRSLQLNNPLNPTQILKHLSKISVLERLSFRTMCFPGQKKQIQSLKRKNQQMFITQVKFNHLDFNLL